MRSALALLLLLAAGGCEQDPFDRPGTWSLPPSGLGSNDTNLRVMLANPNDLIAGTGESTSTGPLAAQPVELLMTGKRRPLPVARAQNADVGASSPNPGGGVGTGSQ